MEKELICIVCPNGCRLKVDIDNKTVSGNKCIRGEAYGINEVTNPVRAITSTVKINGETSKMVPVKTDKPIPKNLNFKCMEEINKVQVSLPVKAGQIIIKNILGTQSNIVATKTIE
ncbi:DUF1667 domain-containing protein [Clostridium frigidicarnis]|uniref:CxxC motif-containing protein n=1 Tax=Clostridium frigidicarnis TaxID=84698 RepID=A0A1I0ZTT0_9CLOT|nr:DUF1667 domain-containing protein [Clostridium frigidicarnis]SFB28917.1 CxxC motif-containing protein [Clostridium frigidicarnis]